MYDAIFKSLFLLYHICIVKSQNQLPLEGFVREVVVQLEGFGVPDV